MRDVNGIRIEAGDKVEDCDGHYFRVESITDKGIIVVPCDGVSNGRFEGDGYQKHTLITKGQDLEVCVDTIFIKKAIAGLVSYQDYRNDEALVEVTWEACERAAKSLGYSFVIAYRDPEEVMIYDDENKKDIILRLIDDDMIETYLDIMVNAWKNGADYVEQFEAYFKALIKGIFSYKAQKEKKDK